MHPLQPRRGMVIFRGKLGADLIKETLKGNAYWTLTHTSTPTRPIRDEGLLETSLHRNRCEEWTTSLQMQGRGRDGQCERKSRIDHVS